ncbi:MAG: HAMP domain-containing protein [Desulfobacteraceae bacterium]|nr:HAMP domain-containing protein [Desulfobacteraceae bacterium]
MKGINLLIRKIKPLVSGISISIRRKLLLGFLLIALVPLITIGAITYIAASNALMTKAKDNLQAIGGTKALAIETFFDERRADMDVLREIVFTMQQKAFEKLVAVRNNKAIWIEDYMLNRLGDVQVLSNNPTIVQALESFKKAGKIYTPEWKIAAKKYGKWLTEYKEAYGYYNIYLVDDKGRVLYSVQKESDLGENLKWGRLKNSPAAKAFRKGMKKLFLQDFEGYEPLAFLPASFIAAPIIANGKSQGVVMGQISIDQINGILQERAGLNQTTEAYLVGKTGQGFELRSERVIKNGTVGDPATGHYLPDALSGKSGTGFKVDEQGVYKLAAYAPINIPGVNWAINVTAEVEEIISPKFEEGEEDFFTYYKEGYGYLNFYLINPEGYMFYSVIHENDYHTNLLKGDYKNTNLGRLVNQVLVSKQLQISDFEKYAPSQNSPAAFIAQPIVIKDKVALIVAAQLTVAQIQVIMEDYTGLGESGDTYLVGPDNLWRTDSRFLDALKVESTILNPEYKVTNDAVTSAMAGRSNAKVVKNYRDHTVMSSWSPITVQPPSQTNPQGVKWALLSDIDIEEVRKPVYWMAVICASVVAITLILIIAVSMALAGGLTAQVNRIMDLFSDIGMGQYDSRAEVISQDELGTMASSLNSMLDNTLNLIQSSEERDAMQDSIMKLLAEISALTEGDLTARAEVTEQITGAIADSFNTMAEQLTGIVKGVKKATMQVDSTSTQVSGSTTTLAKMSELQAKQVAHAISIINSMTKSIQQVSLNASKSADVSKRSMSSAKKGADAAKKTNKAMETIRERVQETARAIKRLGESSQEIGNIIQIITDISDRTSILALNASIQAAMAGEAGRGFAVVAEEVQRLAERSTSSTKQIETLVKNIQSDINEAGKSMDESIQRVVQGSSLANDAYSTLQELELVSSEVAAMVHTISSSAKEQASASESISKTMTEVGQISSKASDATKKTAQSMKSMTTTAHQLRVSVEAFKIEEDPAEDETAYEEPIDGDEKTTGGKDDDIIAA